MTPTAVRAGFVNSESVFKPDIFMGKVLFCTGGGSGICKEMTYAMVGSPLDPQSNSLEFGNEICFILL